jgi:hypothetical protein
VTQDTAGGDELPMSWAIPCTGQQLYARRHRREWLAKVTEVGAPFKCELAWHEAMNFSDPWEVGRKVA